jgi:hypothetical protein
MSWISRRKPHRTEQSGLSDPQLPHNEAYPSATLGSTLGQTCYPDRSIVISYEDHVYMMEEQT